MEDNFEVLRLYDEDISSLLESQQFLINRLASINKLLFNKGLIITAELTRAEEEFQGMCEVEKKKTDSLKRKLNALLP